MKYLVVIALVLGLAAGQSFEIFNEEDNDRHVDCHSLMKAGYNKNGTYRLHVNGTDYFVPCEFRENQAFTIVLYRVDATLRWDRTFHDYQNGFGYPIHDYFSGLEYIHQITTHYSATVLSVHFLDWNNNHKYAINGKFVVNAASTGYQMYVGGGFKGNVQNDMVYSSGHQFYTIDRPDPHGCVHQQRGGWWYYYCTKTLPTGHYYNYGHYSTNKTLGDGIYWQDYLGVNYSMKRLSMSLRRPSENDQF